MSNVPGFHEIDSDASITQLQNLLSTLPRSHPCRQMYVFLLAEARRRRYCLSKQREDLDKAIVSYTESILLPPLLPRYGTRVLVALFFLAQTLAVRSEFSENPEEVIHALKYLSHLRHQPHAIPHIPRHKVTSRLVHVLFLQVSLKAGNMLQNIREIAVLCRELFNLDTADASDIETTRVIIFIEDIVMPKLTIGVPDQPLDELIECLRAARKRRPDLLKGRYALAIFLTYRYAMTSVNDDYEEAASILDDIIAFSSPGNPQDESLAQARGRATGLVSFLAVMRSVDYENPEYLEETIYRVRTSFSSSSARKYFPFFVWDPEATSTERYRYFGSIEGVGGWSNNSPIDSPLTLPIHSDLERHPTLYKMRDLFIEIRDTDDTMKIDEIIEKGRSMLGSSSPSYDSILPDLFCKVLNKAFDRTKNIEYLDESIGLLRQVIEAPLPRAPHSMTTRSLSHSLLTRFKFFPGYCSQDLDEGLELLTQYINTPFPSLPERFRFACSWAGLARFGQHSSVSTAYETAMSLMQGTPLFSPTLQLQHATLIMDENHNNTRSLPLDYASYRIDQHQLEEAIETLERGRALLWSEMRHFRAPIDQLLEVDPDLAHKFAAVNRDLEELTKSVPPSHKLTEDDAATDPLRAVDPFGRLVLKQRGLLKERGKLVSQIQALPGFDSFLASPSFDTLRSAASSGPVIIINHSHWRSDILILLRNMPPSLIPTPDDFFERASALKDELLDSRCKHGLASKDYDKALASVLADLYNLVGKPVVDRLRELRIPEQSRIWWYPTSVFCSLPLHAMGPIPSDDGEPRYFLDLYICSYTPTLSALIQSHHHDSGTRPSDQPSVLLVAQPDSSLPTVVDEIRAVQALDAKVTSLISEDATPTTIIDGFHHHGFVHFACHGTLEAGKPFNAGFVLHGDANLTLLDIVRAHLPTAEFAFLSACHTAEVTEGSVMDEGLHLAAAVQYCGFRSVVGTVWAMVDEDGPDLAKNFYKALFSNRRRDQGLPYHERSAKALQYAVKKLRRKRRITLERWVNFVHYGA